MSSSSNPGVEAPRPGDALGGLAAAAVLLPQSMAFGVTLYAIGGFDASTGAYAGLFGTAVMCIASGIGGGARGVISAPTGPVLVLLGSALAGLGAAGFDDAGVLLGLAAVAILTGILQFTFGALGGGRLIKYIPFPVVSGFMTGSALLMIKSQLEPLSGAGAGDAWASWWWVPAAAALATIIAAQGLPRVLPRVPGPIAGLVTG
ncbi:MAG: SulP family inorganic anion transporter, partial [Gammaproteobacteria bacterium]